MCRRLEENGVLGAVAGPGVPGMPVARKSGCGSSWRRDTLAEVALGLRPNAGVSGSGILTDAIPRRQRDAGRRRQGRPTPESAMKTPPSSLSARKRVAVLRRARLSGARPATISAIWRWAQKSHIAYCACYIRYTGLYCSTQSKTQVTALERTNPRTREPRLAKTVFELTSETALTSPPTTRARQPSLSGQSLRNKCVSSESARGRHLRLTRMCMVCVCVWPAECGQRAAYLYLRTHTTASCAGVLISVRSATSLRSAAARSSFASPLSKLDVSRWE